MAFIRGLFISKGSINDPRKSNYHLELVIKKPELAVIVQQMLLDYGIPMTLTTRRNQSMLYIKKSELISEFLGLVTVGLILEYVIMWGPLALIIVFQPEIRAVLANVSRSGRKQVIDSVAASIILDTYLRKKELERK